MEANFSFNRLVPTVVTMCEYLVTTLRIVGFLGTPTSGGYMAEQGRPRDALVERVPTRPALVLPPRNVPGLPNGLLAPKASRHR